MRIVKRVLRAQYRECTELKFRMFRMNQQTSQKTRLLWPSWKIANLKLRLRDIAVAVLMDSLASCGAPGPWSEVRVDLNQRVPPQKTIL